LIFEVLPSVVSCVAQLINMTNTGAHRTNEGFRSPHLHEENPHCGEGFNSEDLALFQVLAAQAAAVIVCNGFAVSPVHSNREESKASIPNCLQEEAGESPKVMLAQF